MAVLLSAPFVNVLAAEGGARWLCGYGVAAAMGLSAAAVGVMLTVALFGAIGPKRTRLVAQIVAAVIGAAFVIALQLGAILSYGTLSRTDILQSEAFVAHAPDAGGLIYAPALATLGDLPALAGVVAVSILLLGLSIVLFAPRFAGYAAATANVATAVKSERGAATAFRTMSPARTLRQKEWTLLRRDPWLASQTLMQMLYLLPPAVLLSRSFADGSGALLVVVPVLVMAAGQLAGGLAWLAISGEDAPDLIATAPVPAGTIVRAKLEAVMGSIATVFLPFVMAVAWLSPRHAAIAAACIAVAAASASQIQLWFRAQAKRSLFRRRQVSSRVATFAEAFSSITWAATAALASAGTGLAWITGAIALLVLAGAWLISPSKA
jgi:ABC-2 type transport system permease protein